MRAWLLLLLCLAVAGAAPDGRSELPFRTDAANEHSPWYRLKPGEFPRSAPSTSSTASCWRPTSSTARASSAGSTTASWWISPCPRSAPSCISTPRPTSATCRSGRSCTSPLYQDERGDFTRVAAIRDDFTALARDGLTYRLDEIKAGEGKLVVTARERPDRSAANSRVDEHTRFWKGDKAAKLGDLAAGDDLLVNLARRRPLRRHLGGRRGAEARDRAAAGAGTRRSSRNAGCPRGSTAWRGRSSPSRSSATRPACAPC